METLWPATSQVAGNQLRRAQGLWLHLVKGSSTGRRPDRVRAAMTSSNCNFVFVFVFITNVSFVICLFSAAGRTKAGSFSLSPLATHVLLATRTYDQMVSSPTFLQVVLQTSSCPPPPSLTTWTACHGARLTARDDLPTRCS